MGRHVLCCCSCLVPPGAVYGGDCLCCAAQTPCLHGHSFARCHAQSGLLHMLLFCARAAAVKQLLLLAKPDLRAKALSEVACLSPPSSLYSCRSRHLSLTLRFCLDNGAQCIFQTTWQPQCGWMTHFVSGPEGRPLSGFSPSLGP